MKIKHFLLSTFCITASLNAMEQQLIPQQCYWAQLPSEIERSIFDFSLVPKRSHKYKVIQGANGLFRTFLKSDQSNVLSDDDYLKKIGRFILKMHTINKHFHNAFSVEKVAPILRLESSLDPETLLVLATTFNTLFFIKCALNQNANIETINDVELTPLMITSRNNHYDHCALLLKNKANINAIIRKHFHMSYDDDTPKTALEFAINNKNIALVTLFIENGAQLTASLYKRNPLYWAIKKESQAITQLLLNNHNYTKTELDDMLERAREECISKNIIDLLINAGAKEKEYLSATISLSSEYENEEIESYNFMIGGILYDGFFD